MQSRQPCLVPPDFNGIAFLKTKLLRKKWLKKSKTKHHNIYLQETFENKTEFTFQYFQQSASDILVSTALVREQEKITENYSSVCYYCKTSKNRRTKVL